MNKAITVMVALLLLLAGSSAGQQQPQAAKSDAAPQLEAQVRKLWEAFKKRDKTTLSGLLDDGFRMFEEGLTTFGDKKAEVNAVDEYELIQYTLGDFTVKPLGATTAVVTYVAQYEGKSGDEVSRAKSVFGEVWIRSGGEWKALYLQETYVK